MRVVKSIPDVQRALNELFSLYDTLKGKNLDLNQRKVQNAAPATRNGEYVTFEQLPTITHPVTKHKDQFYTIVWDKEDVVANDEITTTFIVGNGREGSPHQAWVVSEGPPTTDDLSINIQYTYYDVISGTEIPTTVDLLTIDLVLPMSTTKRVWSSTFKDPVPMLGNMAKLNGHIIISGGASVVSIGLVIKRKT